MGNCNKCKYHKTTIHIPFSGTIFLRQFGKTYCSYQNCKTIKNTEMECPYFKESLLDKILTLFNKNIKYSDNVTDKNE